MSTIRKIDRVELASSGFLPADKACEQTYGCCSCDKPVKSFKQWWHRTSIEYNEWDCYCRSCALYQIHLYDDFDFEEWERMNAHD